MPDYKITYTLSFILFWGNALAISLYAGGILSFSMVCMMIGVLISHEHAHIKKCQDLNVGIRSVKFTWLGGQVDFRDCDTQYADDYLQIISAGIIDTGYYTFSVLGFIAVLPYIVPPGFNFAMNQPINLLYGIATFLTIMFISNILPIEYRHPEHGIITTDGWAAVRMLELRNEMMNDGRAQAIMI
jgi:hypothetical protein